MSVVHELLRAGLARTWRYRIFWACVLVVFVLGVGSCVSEWSVYKADGQLSRQFNWFSLWLAFGAAIFDGLFLGTEHSEGTLRNKIVAGYGRRTIYLSQFALCSLVHLVLLILWVLVMAVLGIPLLGWESARVGLFAKSLILMLLLCPAWAAVMTLIGMNTSSRTKALLFSVVALIALYLIGVYLADRLDAPEFYSGYAITVDGVTQLAQEPNPRYIADERVRAVLQWIVDILPTGQIASLFMNKVSRVIPMALGSVIVTVCATLGGMVWFEKRDMK